MEFYIRQKLNFVQHFFLKIVEIRITNQIFESLKSSYDWLFALPSADTLVHRFDSCALCQVNTNDLRITPA